MAYGIENMRRIQLGLEVSSVAGGAVAATARWRGPGAQIDSGKVFSHPVEHVGLLVDTDRAYMPFQMATLDFPETPATYEQLPYILAAGVKYVVTGATDTGVSSTGLIYAYPVDETGGDTTATYTLEAGDNNAAAEMEYSFPTEFTLTWAAKEALMLTSKWVGRQRSNATFTVIAALPTVEEILAPSIYVHATTIGSGQILGTLIGYELNYQTGIVPLPTADGNTYFYTAVKKKPTFTLRLTYEHDANATAEYAAFVAGTNRLVRIKHLGSAVAAGGVWATKALQMDFSAKYTNFPPFDAQDGDNVITCELVGGYNATADLFASFTVVNLLASLT